MLKKFAAWLMLCAALLNPIYAHADLRSAFGKLVASSSTSRGGSFTSQSRHIFTGGGANIHFPSERMQLISASGPSFKAGCNGISFHFGGFSFITGEQFKQLVSSIVSNSLGYAIQLGIKTLCPQCDAVLSEMNKLAQMARSGAIDSCKMGRIAVGALAAGLDIDPKKRPEAVSQNCAEHMANTNESSGFLGGVTNTLCNGITGVKAGIEKLEDLIKTLDRFDPEAIKGTTGLEMAASGNITWATLQSLGIGDDSPGGTGIREREFLMSIVGTTLLGEPNGPGAVSCAGNLGPSQPNVGIYCPPSIQGARMAQIFMLCGAGVQPSGSRAAIYCDKYANELTNGSTPSSGAIQVFKCKEPKRCMELEYLQPNKSIFNEGFIYLVERVLKDAVKSVQDGTAISTEGLNLINSAPFPLYQAINIAAVYPDVGEELVANMTILTSLLMAQEYMSRIIKGTNRNLRNTAANPIAARDLLKFLKDLDSETRESFKEVGELFTMQEALVMQIRTINKRIQTEVVSQGLIGNQMFATGLMRSTQNPNGKSSP